MADVEFNNHLINIILILNITRNEIVDGNLKIKNSIEKNRVNFDYMCDTDKEF